MNSFNRSFVKKSISVRWLEDKSGVDKINVKTQTYHLLNNNRELFASFDASNFHKLVNESFVS